MGPLAKVTVQLPSCGQQVLPYFTQEAPFVILIVATVVKVSQMNNSVLMVQWAG